MTLPQESGLGVGEYRQVDLVPGIVAKTEGFHLRYTTATGSSVPICRIVGPETSFTSVRSPSGTGKSTLLQRFVGRLRDRGTSSASDLDFRLTAQDGSDPSIAIGIVPQSPPLVKHWKLHRLLCVESWAAKAVFGNETWNKIEGRVLGELSGGQQRRVYACSVTESLAERPADLAILILDETLDGLNPTGAREFIDRLAEAWSERLPQPLHMLLVTHLPTIAVGNVEEVSRVSLEVVGESSSELRVRVVVAQ